MRKTRKPIPTLSSEWYESVKHSVDLVDTFVVHYDHKQCNYIQTKIITEPKESFSSGR